MIKSDVVIDYYWGDYNIYPESAAKNDDTYFDIKFDGNRMCWITINLLHFKQSICDKKVELTINSIFHQIEKYGCFQLDWQKNRY